MYCSTCGIDVLIYMDLCHVYFVICIESLRIVDEWCVVGVCVCVWCIDSVCLYCVVYMFMGCSLC